MALGITHYQRKDGADRNDLALAALQVCRVLRSFDDIASSKLYWQGWNNIVIVTEGEDTMFDFRGQNPDMAKATSGLADVADILNNYQLAEAKAGQEAYEVAGRPSGA